MVIRVVGVLLHGVLSIFLILVARGHLFAHAALGPLMGMLLLRGTELALTLTPEVESAGLVARLVEVGRSLAHEIRVPVGHARVARCISALFILVEGLVQVLHPAQFIRGAVAHQGLLFAPALDLLRLLVLDLRAGGLQHVGEVVYQFVLFAQIIHRKVDCLVLRLYRFLVTL